MLRRTKQSEWNERRQLWYRGFIVTVKTPCEDGEGIPAIIADAENPAYPLGGGFTRARAIQHRLTGGLFGSDLDTLESSVLDTAKDSIDGWYDQNGHFDYVGKNVEKPASRSSRNNGSYAGTVELGFRSATYPFKWLPNPLNPYYGRAVRQAQHDLRFQRTPEDVSGTDRLRLLTREECWVDARRGVAEAVFEFGFRVIAASEPGVRRYLEWAFSPVPDWIEVTEIERMSPARPKSYGNGTTGTEKR